MTELGNDFKWFLLKLLLTELCICHLYTFCGQTLWYRIERFDLCQFVWNSILSDSILHWVMDGTTLRSYYWNILNSLSSCHLKQQNLFCSVFLCNSSVCLCMWAVGFSLVCLGTAHPLLSLGLWWGNYFSLPLIPWTWLKSACYMFSVACSMCWLFHVLFLSCSTCSLKRLIMERFCFSFLSLTLQKMIKKEKSRFCRSV